MRIHPLFEKLIDVLAIPAPQSMHFYYDWKAAGCPVVDEARSCGHFDEIIHLRNELAAANARIKEFEAARTEGFATVKRTIRNEALEEALTEMGRCFSAGLSYELIATRIRGLKK